MAVGRCPGRRYSQPAENHLNRHDASDPDKSRERICRKVFQAQRKGGCLKEQLGFLNKSSPKKERKGGPGESAKNLGSPLAKATNSRKVLAQILTEVAETLIDVGNTSEDGPVFAEVGAPPNPIGQQRIEGVTIDKNQIGRT